MAKKMIVVRWEERTAWLLERKGDFEVLGSIPLGEDPFPAEWREAQEIRIGMERRIWFRRLELYSVSSSRLLETALFTAEPSLPLPIEDLTIDVTRIGKKGRHVIALLTAISAKELRTAVARVQELAGPEEKDGKPSGPKVQWAGHASMGAPRVLNENVRGKYWAGARDSSTWLDIQSGPDGESAAQALEARHGEFGQWRELTSEEEALWIARAPANRSFPIGVAKKSSRLIAAWPFVLLALALLLIVGSMAIRIAAAGNRTAQAEEIVRTKFSEAMPGARRVAPINQMRSELAELNERYEFLEGRFVKDGSALAVLEALEQIATPSEIRIDDLNISEGEYRLVGSGSTIEKVQELGRRLHAEVGDPSHETNLQYRRSDAGLGLDFTLEGRR